jgi:murein DD-endopeptidase MepM/ murein hydrolase activator NlpD
VAVFFGAFFCALIYATKSDTPALITGSSDSTAAAAGTSADTLSKTGSLQRSSDTLTAPDPTAAPENAGNSVPSASPAVGPGDLDALRAENLLIPVAGVAAKDLVDSFNDRRGGTRTHNALDIMAARNTPVLSATDGKILKLHNSVAGGLTIYESDPSSKYVMMYGHLDSYRPGLKEGEAVKRGQILGFVGSTGNANPLAPHLHFQVTRNDNLKEWWKGTPVNPFPIFRPKG